MIVKLTREDVRKAIRFGGPPRPPRTEALMHDPANIDALGGDDFRRLLSAYPDDTVPANMVVQYWHAPDDDPTYRFAFGEKMQPRGLPIDACPVIADWAELDQFLEEFPCSERSRTLDELRAARRENPDSYVLVCWNHYFHQRLAYIRGIEALLCDFYDARDKLRAVMDRLLDLYRVWARGAAEAGADGVWGGEDLGDQRSLFMRPETFREIYAPYYRGLADVLHSNGLDFWLHSCGNITELVDDLIDCGVDVLHPIQAGTMDDPTIADRYGGRVAFWIGMDGQLILQFGTPDEVRDHVRARKRTFYRPEGGLILGAGTCILPGIPMDNLRAYIETLCE